MNARYGSRRRGGLSRWAHQNPVNRATLEKLKERENKYIPGSESRSEEIFNFPYLVDEKAVKFITDHGRIMFIIRGPPGTGKTTLSSMISKKYPTSVVCSADSYFNQAFVPKLRNKDSLTKSHKFCQKRVEEECEHDTHPLIVQNTHIRRWELNEYLNFATQYGYTVIMAITLRRFVADPEILEQTNKKGLTKDYLEGRISQWQENIPLYLGWFLCPDDESFVLQQAKKTLENSLGDGKLCKEFGVFSEDEIWEHFEIESRLFCIASYCNHGKAREMYHFYLSDTVQQVYGTCFTLSIHGFLITESSVLAVVAVTEDMKPLMRSTPRSIRNIRCDDDAEDEICHQLEAMNTGSVAKVKKETFRKEFASVGKTAKLEECQEGELMNINNMSFIAVAHANKPPDIADVKQFAEKVFSEVTNEEGIIENSLFASLDNGTRYCRLPNKTWLISLPEKITLSAVFTGLYP